MKKKIVTLCLIISLAAVAVVGTTLAYFTDTDQADNVVTVGNLDIELTEPMWEAEGKEQADTMYPGEAVAKDPTVSNLSSSANPCFVRLQVTLPEHFSFRTDWEDGSLGDNWELHGDGYYYYNRVLQPNESTDSLFDQIVLSEKVTNETYGDEEISIPVKAEAVQAQGARVKWEDVQKMTVAEIADWFGTCGMNGQ